MADGEQNTHFESVKYLFSYLTPIINHLLKKIFHNNMIILLITSKLKIKNQLVFFQFSLASCLNVYLEHRS